jgi:ankyrin repeat protein
MVNINFIMNVFRFCFLSAIFCKPELKPISDKLYLTKVAQSGNLTKLKSLLVDPNYDPTWENSHAFQMACEAGHLDIINEFLLDNRIDPSVGLNSPLYYSAGRNHFNIVSRLLQEKRVINSAIFDHPGKWAHEQGHYEMAIMLTGVVESVNMQIRNP